MTASGKNCRVRRPDSLPSRALERPPSAVMVGRQGNQQREAVENRQHT
jgi:hypothetical protein